MTSKKQRKVPELRFRGFTDDWEQRKLSELVDMIGTGKSNYTIHPQFDDINQFPILGSTSVIGYDSSYDVDGQLILTARVGANAGSLYTFSGKAKVTDNTVFLVSSHPVFIKSLLDNFDLRRLSFGTGQPLVKASELQKLKLLSPGSPTELLKIERLFKTVDNYIALHQRKQSLLKKLKQGYLQKLFPQKGQRQPELRFSGFTDDWEQRKLGDEVSFFSGLTYSPDEVASEGVLVIRSSNVKDGSLVNADNIYVSSETANVTRVKSGDIVVVVRNGSKRLIGKHAIFKTSIQAVIGAFMTGIRTEQFDFFNAVLDGVQFRDEINKNLGATINQITTGNFKAMHFTIPINSSERDRIGKIFRSVDDTIALHQQEIDRLQQLKQGYLQKMFV